MAREKVVFPGDLVGTSEEFIAGEGTYEEEGNIYSTQTGTIKIDPQEMMASVEPLTSVPVELKLGDHIIGIVTDIRGSMVEVNIEMVQGRLRKVSGGTLATMHISKLSRDFVQDIHMAYRIGDIIRARILQVRPSVRLTSAGPMLGALRSLCLTCRVSLQPHKDKLLCPVCERVFDKKIAKDYGEFKTSDLPPE